MDPVTLAVAIAKAKAYTDETALAAGGAKGHHTIGGYYTRVQASQLTTTNAHGNEAGHLSVVSFARTVSVDRIGINTTAPGEAGSVVRLGIYRLPASGNVWDRVLDAGTVDATTVASMVQITIDQELTPGIYGLMYVAQNAPTTRPTVRNVLASDSGGFGNPWAFIPDNIPQREFHGLVATGFAAGALPATFTPTTILTNTPVVYVRVKA